MTAKEAISPVRGKELSIPTRRIGSDMPLLDVLPRLLDSPGHELGVEESGEFVGVIDAESLLEALGRQISARDDCSVIEVECGAIDFSASLLARAVEDTDVHLVDMLTAPGADGHINITLRVRCQDPTATVHSLERYGYKVTSASGRENADTTAAIERLLELHTIMNI